MGIFHYYFEQGLRRKRKMHRWCEWRIEFIFLLYSTTSYIAILSQSKWWSSSSNIPCGSICYTYFYGTKIKLKRLFKLHQQNCWIIWIIQSLGMQKVLFCMNVPCTECSVWRSFFLLCWNKFKECGKRCVVYMKSVKWWFRRYVPISVWILNWITNTNRWSRFGDHCNWISLKWKLIYLPCICFLKDWSKLMLSQRVPGKKKILE